MLVGFVSLLSKFNVFYAYNGCGQCLTRVSSILVHSWMEARDVKNKLDSEISSYIVSLQDNNEVQRNIDVRPSV